MELPEAPIQRHYNGYPKDFTPGTLRKNRVHTIRQIPKYVYNQQYSFNVQQNNSHSVQLTHLHEIKDIAVQTLNPQVDYLNQQQLPLNRQKHHQSHKIQIEVEKTVSNLQKRAFNVQNHESECIDQTSQQNENSSPGSIKKQPFSSQKPLDYQEPITVEIQTAQKMSHLKINSVNSKFIQSMNKTQSTLRKSPNYQQKKIPGISRGENQQGTQGSFRLNKRFSMPDSGRRASKLLNISVSKQAMNQALSKKKTMFFDRNKVSEINQHLNQIIQKRKERLSPPKQTQQAQICEQNPTQYSANVNLNRINYQSNRQNSGWKTSDLLNNKNLGYNMGSMSRKQKMVTISYKTSLGTLKDILNVREGVYVQGQIKLPKILRKPLFNKNHNRVQIYEAGCKIFEELGIKADNIIVKKYSNCVLIVNRNVSLLWHFEGRVYLGQWQTEYLDQGFRHGLGIQWVPNHSIYYGQFSRNKKQGLGVIKRASGDFYVGLWSKGKPFGFGRTYCQNGQILSNKKREESSESEQSSVKAQAPFDLFMDP